MTKLEKLINEYFATKDLTLNDHIREMKYEMECDELNDELIGLLHYLNKVVE